MLEQASTIRSSSVIQSAGYAATSKAHSSKSSGKDRVGAAKSHGGTTAPKMKKGPTLQQPDPSGEDSLLDITEALVAVYKSAAKMAIDQNNGITGLQEDSEMMSSVTIAATNKSIDDQTNEFTKEQQATKAENKDAKTSAIESDVGYALMAVMLVVTVGSALFDAGASLMAVPEEMDVMEMTDMGVEADEAAPVEEAPVEAEVNSPQTQENVSDENMNESQSTRENQTSSNQSAREDTESKLQKAGRWLKTKGGGIGTRLAVMGASTTPDIMSGVTKYKISDIQDEVANLQKIAGQSAGALEEVKMENTWYQQSLQLQTTNATDFVGELENVYGAASDTLSMYKQIATMGYRPA